MFSMNNACKMFKKIFCVKIVLAQRWKQDENCLAGQSGEPSDWGGSSSGPDGGDHDQGLLCDAGLLGRSGQDWRVHDEQRLVQNWVSGNILNLYKNQRATMRKNTVGPTFVLLPAETWAPWTPTATCRLRAELKTWSSEEERTFTRWRLNSSCTNIPKLRRLRLGHTPGTRPKSHLVWWSVWFS